MGRTWLRTSNRDHPSLGAADTLGACLEALRQQGLPGPAGEVFVVDDRARDNSAAIARQAMARYCCS